jgi:hypothetical protein
LASTDLEGLAGHPQRRIVDLDADDGVRADKGAFAALDADVGFPDGDLERDVALFPLGGAGGVGAVALGHFAHRQVIAAPG